MPRLTHLFLTTLATASLIAGAAAAQADGAAFYGSLGYKQNEDLDLGAIQGRLGAKLSPHFAVEGELAAGIKSHKLDMPPAFFKRSLILAGLVLRMVILLSTEVGTQRRCFLHGNVLSSGGPADGPGPAAARRDRQA